MNIDNDLMNKPTLFLFSLKLKIISKNTTNTTPIIPDVEKVERINEKIKKEFKYSFFSIIK